MIAIKKKSSAMRNKKWEKCKTVVRKWTADEKKYFKILVLLSFHACASREFLRLESLSQLATKIFHSIYYHGFIVG